MENITRSKPDELQKIVLNTEAQLYKHKRRLYPQCINNMGDGYSQFFDESTRNSILKKVKQELTKAVGVGQASAVYDNEEILIVLEESVKLMKEAAKQERIDKRETNEHRKRVS